MAGIRKDTGREVRLTVPAATVTEVRFSAIGGEFPNTFQILNAGLQVLYIGSLPSVSNAANFEQQVVGSGGSSVYVRPAGSDVIYLYTTAQADVIIRSFISDEIFSTDLPQTLQTVIINSTVSSSVTLGAAIPAGANVIGGITVADGSDSTQGAKADAAITNPASTGSLIAFTKGIVSKLADLITAVSAMAGAGTQVATSPAIYNVTLTSANTEYSQALPSGTKKFSVSIMDGDYAQNYRYAFETGKVATPTAPYMKLPQNVGDSQDGVLLTGVTLYLAASDAGKVAQIMAWT